DLITQVQAPLVGTVLNGISRDMGEGYAFEYGYDLEGRPAAGEPADGGDDHDATDEGRAATADADEAAVT
ncbi:MAG TPA: hypothetical protein PKA98_11255, partial [Acidimicrobiales bacterium]|nr:hypothetical protein [Acidimicrobiales bacterium]